LRERGIDPDGFWPAGQGPEQESGRPGDWQCTACGVRCFASKGQCFRCGAPKPMLQQPPPPPGPPPGAPGYMGGGRGGYGGDGGGYGGGGGMGGGVYGGGGMGGGGYGGGGMGGGGYGGGGGMGGGGYGGGGYGGGGGGNYGGGGGGYGGGGYGGGGGPPSSGMAVHDPADPCATHMHACGSDTRVCGSDTRVCVHAREQRSHPRGAGAASHPPAHLVAPPYPPSGMATASHASARPSIPTTSSCGSTSLLPLRNHPPFAPRPSPLTLNPPFPPHTHTSPRPAHAHASDALRWVVAKRTRDFTMADRLRDEMRKGGVDPSEHRPKEWPGWSDATQRYATAQGLAAERADWDRKKQLGQTGGPRYGQ
jgi:hypothetical protein